MEHNAGAEYYYCLFRLLLDFAPTTGTMWAQAKYRRPLSSSTWLFLFNFCLFIFPTCASASLLAYTEPCPTYRSASLWPRWTLDLSIIRGIVSGH